MKPSPHFLLPGAFKERMKSQLGADYSTFIDSLEDKASWSVRLHPVKKTQQYEFPLTHGIPWESNGYFLEERIPFTLDPVFHGGAYYVQEPSSMLIGPIVKKMTESLEQPVILDLCGAPGGKSTSLLSALGGRGLLISNETISGRVSALQHNLIKWGYTNTILTQADPEQFRALPDFFDLILVDAPCSGEGLFRKDQASRNQWSEDIARQCSRRQRRILSDIILSLKPEGVLIYATCTFNPSENLEQLQWLGRQGFESIPIPWFDLLPLVRLSEKGISGYQAYPHLMQGEGFFVGVMRKSDGHAEGPQRLLQPKIEWSAMPVQAAPYVNAFGGLDYFIHRDINYAFPSDMANTLETVRERIRIVEAGISIGQLKNKDFVPAHPWAQALQAREDIPAISLEKGEALQYLRKNAFSHSEMKYGYQLIKYQGITLGWIKGLKDRINNLYPNHYRILLPT